MHTLLLFCVGSLIVNQIINTSEIPLVLPGGPLVSEVGYHPRKKIHVIRVVFQDKAMYARTSFRGAKTCKIGKKGMFLVILTNFWMDMTLKLRKRKQKRVFRVYFQLFSYLKNTCLGCVLKILLRGWYPAWNTSGPPGLVLHIPIPSLEWCSDHLSTLLIWIMAIVHLLT